MSTLSIKVKLSDTAVSEYVKASSNPREQALALEKLMRALKSGTKDGNLKISYSSSSPVQASGTITVASIQADDTITIGKTTLTGKSSPSGENQFDSDGSNSVVAAAIAAKINAHSVLSLLGTATASNAVVTFTAHAHGSLGNHIALASSNGSRLAVSAAYLASGTGGEEAAPTSFTLGLA